MKDSTKLKNKKIDYDRLIEYGFIKNNENYIYNKLIIDNKFKLIIIIDLNNVITSKVVDNNNEEYVLYNVDTSVGKIVGIMRDEYDRVINDVIDKCCSMNVFKSKYANLIINYINKKYNDELEYLWDKFPLDAVVRNKINNKWYCALLVIDKTKLGIEEDGCVEIIDLLIQPEKITELVDNNKYFPGYHMNKKHWITIKLDGTVDVKEIYKFIDESYNISVSKGKK